MGLRKTPAALAALGAAAALAIAGCGSSGSSTTGATSSSSAPSQLTVWRMGASVPSEVTWMNGMVAQFHKDYLSPAKYVGQTELGNIGATSGGANEDFAVGKLDLYIDGPWASANFTADWDLIQVTDSTPNATSFANLQGFFPPHTSALTGGAYSSSQLMSGFAEAASDTQISPLNAKNWATADSTDYVIPTMIKSLMNGAASSASRTGAS